MEPDDHLKGAEKAAESPMAKMAVEEDTPDPDEGDLDDLDGGIARPLSSFSITRRLTSSYQTDMLDEFSSAKPGDSKHATPKRDPVQAKKPQESDTSEAAAEEFSKQLQEQMAALMGSTEETPAMKKELQAMMQELGNAADPGVSLETKKDAKAAASALGVEEPFQDTIRKTMERMQASGEQATAAAKSNDPEDILAQMMKEMQNGGVEGSGSDEGFNKMLMGMMEQLTNKEILYEPMKELHEKYPAWMEKNKTNTKADDMNRYVEQQKLVKDIVGRFENNNYSDNNATDREYIIERMQQVCFPFRSL